MTNDELPLYQIVDWDKHFENYKSRSVARCNFVCVPNKHGGRGLTALLMSAPEPWGFAYYAVWQLMLQFCSRQMPPRSGWLTADGRKEGARMPAAEWARMLRCSHAMIRNTFRALESVEFIKLIEGRSEAAEIDEITAADTDRDTKPDTDRDTKPDTKSISGSDAEGRNEGKNERTPIIPKEGIGRSGLKDNLKETERHTEPGVTDPVPPSEQMRFEDYKRWVNTLFGRQRAWSYEEDSLLSQLMPISREDRALLSWAYTLPKDGEGWAIVRGRRASKPKQSCVQLLREFSSEIDKWRQVRRAGNDEDPVRLPDPPKWTDERRQAFRELFPDVPITCQFYSLGESIQRQIDKQVRLQADEIPAEWVAVVKKLYGADAPIPEFKHQIAPSTRSEIEAEISKTSPEWTPDRREEMTCYAVER